MKLCEHEKLETIILKPYDRRMKIEMIQALFVVHVLLKVKPTKLSFWVMFDMPSDNEP